MTNIIKKQSIFHIFQKYGLILLVLIMCIVLGFISPTFFTLRNIINVFRQVSINGIIAVGMTFILLTGNIDISVGSLVAVAGVISGSILVNDPSNIFMACVAAISVCAILGFTSGIMVANFSVPPMIATLAMMTIARGIALVYAGGRPYQLASDGFAVLGQGDVGVVPVPVIIFAIVLLVFYIFQSKTAFGRRVYALGGNRYAAEASGINCRRVTRIVFAISGCLAGLSGVVLASRIGSGQPAIGVGYEMDAIAACVIGGTSTLGGVGSLGGTVVGVLIIGLISNALTLLNVDAYWQQIVKGVIIAVAVILDMSTKRNNK